MTDEDKEIDSLANILEGLDNVLENLNKYCVSHTQLEESSDLASYLDILHKYVSKLGTFIFNKKALQALKIERKKKWSLI